MRTLYPAIRPYSVFRLAVGGLHELYVEECGTPDGIPVLFVHGGPGTGCSEVARRFFDPEKYRIILFDQRGCGRSTPHAAIESNTTHDLLSDIEKIRKHLGVDRWVLFGGSWGATLSLLYAQAHPATVMAMVLRGAFLVRQQDFDWFFSPSGAARVFPDEWRNFESIIPEYERDDMLAAYRRRLEGEDELARMSAAKHWAMWEWGISTLRGGQSKEAFSAGPHSLLARARIGAHYFSNQCFVESGQILSNMKYIDRIQAVIVHGRYDMICPLDNARLLADNWTESELHIVREAGHLSTEPGITSALIQGTDRLSQQFGG